MKVHIENNIYLESDDHQFIIKEYTGKKDQNQRDLYNILAYITSLDYAFKFLLKLKVKQSTAEDLKELISAVKRIEKLITDQASHVKARVTG